MGLKTKMLRKILLLKGLTTPKRIRTVCPEGIGASTNNETAYKSVQKLLQS